MPRAPKLLWKIPAVIIAVISGLFGTSQVGWSGAHVVLNFREMGLASAFGTSVFFDQQNVEYVAGTTCRVRPGAGVQLLGNLFAQIKTPNG